MDEQHDSTSNDELYVHHSFTADKGQNPLRVDKFLFNFLEDTSRSRIQKAADAESIHVNGLPVKSNYKVKAGDTVELVWRIRRAIRRLFQKTFRWICCTVMSTLLS